MLSISRQIKTFFLITRYLTIRKLYNLVLIAVSYLLSVFKTEKHKACKPFFLSVEVSNFCNLHCPECPTGTRQIPKSEQKKIDKILFVNLIDELKPSLAHLILYFQGEPLLNKELPELINYAHRSGIFTSTSTNAQLLTKDNAKLLVLSGLDKLIVSVDGASQESYEQYRVGGKLEKALKGIEYIVYWKKELKSFTPIVEMQCLVLKTNEHQLNDMKKLAKTLHVDRLAFKTAQLYDYEHGNKRMTTIARYSRYKMTKKGVYQLKAAQPDRCFRLWSGGVVNASGEVLPCCFDKLSEHSFGNISESGYSACYQNKKASGFRESILSNRKQHEICRNCTG